MSGHADVVMRVLRGEQVSAVEKIQALGDIATDANERSSRLLAENQRLRDLFKPEPYRGVKGKLVCESCLGQGEKNGRNSDGS